MSCDVAYTTTPGVPVAEQKHLVCVCVCVGVWVHACVCEPGPYLGILHPWAQENFVLPLISSYSVMCKQKQHKKLTKDKTL
jgi:hypothetical protein